MASSTLNFRWAPTLVGNNNINKTTPQTQHMERDGLRGGDWDKTKENVWSFNTPHSHDAKNLSKDCSLWPQFVCRLLFLYSANML